MGSKDRPQIHPVGGLPPLKPRQANDPHSVYYCQYVGIVVFNIWKANKILCAMKVDNFIGKVI